MRTYVYIDGFNFYYGATKNTDLKWLDPMALTKKLVKPHNQIQKINYFTARVSGKINDPQKPQRQDIYLRAMQAHIPELEIFFGHFLTHEVSAPLANPSGKKKFATIIKTEEKGSDVNLAVHLLNDAWLDLYDCAIVISNDSDLAEAMCLVKKHHPKKVIGLFTPTNYKTSRELQKQADFVKTIRKSALKAAQLPDTIPGTNYSKPKNW